MLVLSRKVGQRILIGDKISITVVRVAGGGVRLGIEAPEDLPVIREELKEQFQRADAHQRATNPASHSPVAERAIHQGRVISKENIGPMELL